MRIWTFLLAWLTGLLLHGAAVAAGTVVAIGGALRDDNAEVWQRVVQAAGGGCIGVIAIASGEPARSAAHAAAQLRRHGGCALPVVGADDLASAGGVFFTGGAQARLMDALQPGGSSTPLLQAVRALLARGGVVAGTSSGAAVLSAVAFRDAPDLLAALRAPLRDGIEVDRGFALLPPQVVVDQHFLRRGRIGRLLPLMASRGVPIGLGVEEDSAIVVRGDDVEVIGRGGVLVADLSQAVHDASAGAFKLHGARLSLLRRGDRYDLRTRRASAAPASAQRLGGSAVLAPGEDFFPDLLGDGMLARAMGRLVASAAPEVTGLAFRPDGGAGFRWRLTKGDDSAGWAGDSGDDGSVVNLRLAVEPVRMAEPLFHPLTPTPKP